MEPKTSGFLDLLSNDPDIGNELNSSMKSKTKESLSVPNLQSCISDSMNNYQIPINPQYSSPVKTKVDNTDPRSEQGNLCQIYFGELMTCIHQLWVNEKYCDVMVVCSGGHKIQCHRVILVSNSAYFADDRRFVDCGGTYDLNGFSGKAVSLVLEYMYGCPLFLNKNNIQEIQIIAKTLKIVSLISECKKYCESFSFEMKLEPVDENEWKQSVHEKDEEYSDGDSDNEKYDENSGDETDVECYKSEDAEPKLISQMDIKSEGIAVRDEIDQNCKSGGAISSGAKKRKSKMCQAETKLKRTKHEETKTKSWMESDEDYEPEQNVRRKKKSQKQHDEDYAQKPEPKTRRKYKKRNAQNKCDQCRRKFDTEEECLDHKMMVHDPLSRRWLTTRWCDMCGQLYARQEMWRHKLKVHDVGNEFSAVVKCSHCEEMFKYKEMYEEHVFKSHNIRIYLCFEKGCDEICEHMDMLDTHTYTAHEGMRFPCGAPDCNFSTAVWDIFIEHYLDKMHLHCPVCKTVVSQRRKKGLKVKKESLLRHLKTEHNIMIEGESSLCHLCSFQAVDIWDIQIHQKRRHSDTTLQCEQCKKWIRPVSYEKHVRCCRDGRTEMCQFCGREVWHSKSHEKKCDKNPDRDQGIECRVCLKKCADSATYIKHSYRKHGLMVNGATPMYCENCGYMSVTHREHKYHIRHYHKEKVEIQKQKCDICNKECDSRHLKKHMYETHSEKQFPCIECSYACSSKAKLVAHYSSQHFCASRKPFQCAYCTYRSAITHNVTKHIQVQHPGCAKAVNQLEPIPIREDFKKFIDKPAEDTRNLDEFLADLNRIREKYREEGIAVDLRSKNYQKSL